MRAVCVCQCVWACVRAWVRACVCVCVCARARVRVCVSACVPCRTSQKTSVHSDVCWPCDVQSRVQMGWRRERVGYLALAGNVLAKPMATPATGQITGPNTSVQVIPQDQTRVCRSDHRTKHECAGQTTGPNTSVQVRSQDQTRVCRSDHRTKHECSTGQTTGQNTSLLANWSAANEMMMMRWCLMSSDVSWHTRDKLWPMPKHGSVILYVHGNQKAR